MLLHRISALSSLCAAQGITLQSRAILRSHILCKDIPYACTFYISKFRAFRRRKKEVVYAIPVAITAEKAIKNEVSEKNNGINTDTKSANENRSPHIASVRKYLASTDTVVASFVSVPSCCASASIPHSLLASTPWSITSGHSHPSLRGTAAIAEVTKPARTTSVGQAIQNRTDAHQIPIEKIQKNSYLKFFKFHSRPLTHSASSNTTPFS